MSAARPDTIRLVAARREGSLARTSCEALLEAMGFAQGATARDALDQLLAHPHAGLDAAELLDGCATAADPDRALYNAGRLLATEGCPASPVEGAELGRFLGASQHMADLLLGRPELLTTLGRPFDPSTIDARYREAAAADDPESALRRHQQEDELSIAWADLIGGLDVEQVTILLSRLADAVITGAAAATGADARFAVLALGKLGGMELNYSSDIDLLFVRPDGAGDPQGADDVARRLVALLSRQTADGHLYRVDMRLRPDGATGQLTRSVGSCLDYYEQSGRPWERQMLTKGRVVVDCGEAGEQFLRGTRAWILRCGMDADAVRQFKRLKAASEARADEAADVKHAPGGIRDIETIVQFLSLLHAQHNPWLLCNATLHGLERLRVAGVLSSMEAVRLRNAYLFHRRVENLLQVMHRVQTHSLPADRRPLCRLLGRRDEGSLLSELGEHRRRVRAVFDDHFSRSFPATEGPASEVSQLLVEPEPDEAALERALVAAGLRDGAAARAVLLRAAAPVSRFLPTSRRQVAALAHLMPTLLERLSMAADPGAAFDRFERMTRGVGAREILYTRLRDDPVLLRRLCDLADGSPHLAEGLSAEPWLFDAFQDALQTGTRGRRQRRTQLIRRDAAHTDPWLELADYRRIETLRTAVRDLGGELTTPQVLAELSHLCIDILRHAYDLVLAAATREHGEPTTIKGVSRREVAHMVVVAMGKVGGLEANYGSDADVVFVYGGEGQTTRGVPNSVFFTQVAEEFIAHLGGSRDTPRLYKVDTRLRPEGTQGPLVTTLRAFTAYHESPRAALFERQAQLKARIVAGDTALGQNVISTIRRNLRRWTPPDDLFEQMRGMRGRIEAQAGERDLKRGTGGMVDIEQLTQSLQLAHIARHPALAVQETPRALEILGDERILRPEQARWLIETYLFFRRVETRLQIALGLDTKTVPPAGRELRNLAMRLGYADSAEGDAGHLLLGDLEQATADTRARYEQLMR